MDIILDSTVDADTVFQIFDDFPFSEDCAQPPMTFALVHNLICNTDRVSHITRQDFRVTNHRTVCPVFVIQRIDRRQVQRIHDGRIFTICLFRPIRIISHQAHPDIQTICYLGRHIRTEVITFIIRIADDTILAHITTRKCITSIFRTTINRQLILLCQSIAIQQILPIVIRHLRYRSRVKEIILIATCPVWNHILAACTGIKSTAGVRIVDGMRRFVRVCRDDFGIQPSLVTSVNKPLYILVAVHHFDLLFPLLESDMSIQLNSRFAYLPLLSRDNNNSIRSS